MLRVGQKPEPKAEAPAPPAPLMPDQMDAASQPDVQGGDVGSKSHQQELMEALVHMKMAMELIMSCLSKYEEDEEPVDNGQEEADEAAPPGGEAGPQGVPGY